MLWFVATACVIVAITWLMRKLRVGNYDDKFVFITGCDTGFGNRLARKLDKLGLHVFAGCLTKTGAKFLRAKCSSKLVTVEIDVTNEMSIVKAVTEVKKRLPTSKGKSHEKKV